jgi:hypothetical protein
VDGGDGRYWRACSGLGQETRAFGRVACGLLVITSAHSIKTRCGAVPSRTAGAPIFISNDNSITILSTLFFCNIKIIAVNFYSTNFLATAPVVQLPKRGSLSLFRDNV